MIKLTTVVFGQRGQLELFLSLNLKDSLLIRSREQLHLWGVRFTF